MIPTLTERSLESLIVAHLTERESYELRRSEEFDRDFCLDLGHLKAFLCASQAKLVEDSGILRSGSAWRKFCERVQSEVTKRGVVDVLRKGISHSSNHFALYMPLPSALSEQGEAYYRQNKFAVVRQLHYSKRDPHKSVDLILSINGLPVLTMELKNQLTKQSTAHAVVQYRSARDPKELLFVPGRCAVHFALDDETVEMCTQLKGRDSWFLPFNKGCDGGAGNPVRVGGVRTAYLWEEVLTKRSLSDILEHFAQSVREGNSQRVIWPRYHQLEVVRNLLASTSEQPIGSRYLIQHSAGSGKSNSITWLAYQLVEQMQGREPRFNSVIIITDRKNLDKQTRNNVRSFTHSEHIVEWSDCSQRLKELLEAGTKIIITTVQKFSFILGLKGKNLANRRFAVIIDEAHSSQSGRMSAAVNQTLLGASSNTVIEDEDEINSLIEAHIAGRRMAANANFYAFTATPKNKTLEIFGMPFSSADGETGHHPYHLYSMRQAIEEGFIEDVLRGYTVYDSYYRIRKAIEDDPEFERKQAMRKLRYHVESQPETIGQKAAVIVEHFHTAVAHRIGGKARCMICTAGIQRAIDYFHEVRRLLSERGSQYEAIVAFSGEVDYKGTKVSEASLNVFPSSEIEVRVRTGNYRFLIVADKFQTGYDEPLLHTMYVDKPLAGVQAVQTLSRLNRKRPGKEETFVLDFVNSAEDIERAFQPFYQATILSRETDRNKLNELLYEIEQHELYLESEVETLNGLYWCGADHQSISPLIDKMKDRFLALEDEAKVIAKSAIKAYVRTYDFLSTVMDESSTIWEKKYTLLSLLLPKLPSLGADDLTRGLLEAVDFDAYRLQKQEERSIQLQNINTEIEPVPSAAVTSISEDDMQKLSEIERGFNELFGAIEWQDSDLVRKQIDELTERVKNDASVRNAMLRNDEATANKDCDASTEQTVIQMMSTHSELMVTYLKDPAFQERLNEIVRDRVRAAVNPIYDEEALKAHLREEFKDDFANFADGEHYPELGGVIQLFFEIVRAECSDENLAGLRKILQHTLNCLYHAEHREEDYRTWYATLVTRFEAFLKKVYLLREGQTVPPTDKGREAALLDTVRHFPKLKRLYYNRKPKYETFAQSYRVVYDWRNRESHSAQEIPPHLLPTALHDAVALYLYTTMISAEDLTGKL